MKNNNIIKLCLLLVFTFMVFYANAQFRMVSNGIPSWTTVNDSTYEANINLQSDLTGNSFIATSVTAGWRVFTSNEQIYRIETVLGTTFSSVNIRVVEVSNDYITTNGSPLGQCMIYDPASKETIPDAPFGSTGATATMNAAVVTYNAKIISDGGSGNFTETLDVFYYNDNTPGNDYSLPIDTLLKYDHLYINLRSDPANDAVLTLPEPTSGQARAKTIIVNFGGAELNPGLGIVTCSNVFDILQNNCSEPGTVYGPDTVITTNEDQRFLVYRTTSNSNDYYRECEGLLIDQDGNVITTGDTVTLGGSELVYETQTVGSVVFDIAYQGEGITIANPSAGDYTLTPTNGTDLLWATVTGDNTTLNASQEMIITCDNSTNSTARRFIVQVYDDNNDGVVDQQVTSTNHTQSVTTNTTTITVPGLNGFGATGYKIELR